MNLQRKRRLMDEREIKNTLENIASGVLNQHENLQNLALVGIRTRGVFLAERLDHILQQRTGIKVPSGIMDITLYRDDLTSVGPQPVVNRTIIPFNITGKKIILVDDVFYTGRTMRAALDELMDFGRPSLVQIAVLIDRGRHELPIHADFIGHKIDTSSKEVIEVNINEVDGKEEVLVLEKT